MSKRVPRLKFDDEEIKSPKAKKATQKADKTVDKFEKAEKKIPKKMFHEDVDKPKPSSKLTTEVKNTPINVVSAKVHKEISENEDDNIGVESVHKIEQGIEGTARTAKSIDRSRKLKPYRETARAEKKADRANVEAMYQKAKEENPQFSSNPYSKWQQKQAIKKEYYAAKAGKSTSEVVGASEAVAKSAKKAAKTKETGEKVVSFISNHKTGLLIAGGVVLALLLLFSMFSSGAVIVQSGLGGVGLSTYPSSDEAMTQAEQQYSALESELQNKLNNYESSHGYDEYHYELDEISHDPYVLISTLTALHSGEWTIDQVQSDIQMLFDKQYTLTEKVITEVRYREETKYKLEWYVDDEENLIPKLVSYKVDVPYNYYICYVTLKNNNLSHIPSQVLNEDELSLYSVYMATLGNRPDLFPESEYTDKYINTEYPKYEIPEAALSDEHFAAIIAEAEKYLGYPYVFGGSSPSTSFDCSGYVSWVFNHSGWNIGRQTAQGLYDFCTPVSSVNVKPGDLVFFEGTYDAGRTVTHVGIYVGNNMMIHCGDPIQYESLTKEYWQEHFYAYGRLPNP